MKQLKILISKSTLLLMASVIFPAFGQMPDDYFLKGTKKSDEGDSGGAITAYTKAIEMHPDHYLAYYNRGVEKKKMKDFQAAIEDFSRSIEIQPNYQAFYNRAKSKEVLEDYKSAIIDLTRAIEINPRHIGSYFDRGINKMIIGKTESGKKDLKKALAILRGL